MTTLDSAAHTLRHALDHKRSQNQRFTIREAVAIIVPLATHVAELTAAGETFLLFPAAIKHGKAGVEVELGAAKALPKEPFDKACLAPECRTGTLGDARAAVFSLGAILYELVTGASVGPGMRRPTEVVPSLPAQLDVVLGKALVGDPKHRPSDIAALAQAIHHLAPTGSMPPPSADESHLDHDGDFDVDVSLSMIPPPPTESRRQANADPFAAISRAPAAARAPNPDDPTQQLATLKARLEADPRPRYVVVKDGMDHGPFSAVELLQQIASHSFVSDHPLRDEISSETRKIEDWEDFAQFAHQAKLGREIKQERKALDKVVSEERRSSQWKTLVGVGLLLTVAAAGIGWWTVQRGQSENAERVHDDKASSVDTDLALSAGKEGPKGGPGGVRSGGSGSHPQIAGGGSCEAAIAKYVEDYTQSGTKPDLGAADFGAVLNRGGYLNACGAPSNMDVSICAAVQNGRAVGVTVVTKPSNPGISGCIASQVRGLGFPAHSRMDVARTHFAAQ